MLSISIQQWQQWLGEYWWTFVRVAGCLMVMPVFGARTVPVRIRLALALALTVLIAPLVTIPTGVDMLSGTSLVITVQQMLIGVAMGFAVQVVFDALVTGGQLLSNGIGLSFAMNIDPLHGANTPVLGQLYMILMTLTFLALDGHMAIIDSLVQSFTLLPVGTRGLGSDGLWMLVVYGGLVFSGALLVALPSMAAALVVNLSFGVMSRAAPSMNLFGVGFPVILALGLMVVTLSISGVQTQFLRMCQDVWMVINQVLQASAPLTP
jgi:flagellar biosynthesis protein FliR